MEMYWYNYDTKDYDYCDPPNTVEGMLPYIPDWDLDDSGGPSRALFKLYVEMGDSINDAAIKVLTLNIGKDN